MKKIVAMMLAIVLIVGMIPLNARAIEAEAEEVSLPGTRVEPNTQSRVDGFSKNYTLTGNGASDMVAIALAQENRTGSQFGYTEEWCADFVSDCAILAGQGAAIPQYGGVGGLYDRIIGAGGRVTTSSPQPGDICFIDWNGGSSMGHVEIVYQVSGTTVYTIGGNSGSGSTLYTRTVKKHAPLSSGYVVSIVRPAYQDQATSYLNSCTYYPSYVSIKTPSASKLWNIPCSDSTSDDAVNIAKTSAGETLTATALYLNTAGNYWYRVSYNGATCYLYGGNTTYQTAYYSDVAISNVVAPSRITQGSTFSIGGTITSNYNYINYIEANVYSNATDDLVLSSSVTVNTRSYSLRSSTIDNELTFNTLGTGSYAYDINARVRNYYTPDGDALQSEYLWIDLYSTDFTVASQNPTPTTYTVTYNANGGSGAPASQTKTAGTALTLSTAVPSRFGYSFRGWATSSSATSAAYLPGDSYTNDANVTLYAVWAAAEELSGSTYGQFQRNASVSCPDAGVYYAFIPNANALYRITSSAEQDTRVYLYDADGNLLASDDDSGGNLNFLLTYDFTANETYYIYVRFYGSETTGTIPITISKRYSITYDANGGTGAPAAQYHFFDEAVTLSTEEPTRYGYMFLGWSTSSTADTASYFPGEECVRNANLMLYAVWQTEIEQIAGGTCGTSATWTLYENGLLDIRGSGLESYSDTEPAPWYAYREQITTAALEEGIGSVTNYLFYNCTNLASVTLPDSVTRIGYGSFYNCCSLVDITIPENVYWIGDYSFYGCSSLRYLEIPEDVIYIWGGAFSSCTSLGNLTIPARVSTIGEGAFASCNSMTCFTVAEGNDTYTTVGGVLFTKDLTQLVQYPAGYAGTSYTVPGSVNHVWRLAFGGCSNLSEITLHEGITEIGSYAFMGCTGLTEVEIPSSVAGIAGGMFKDCKNLKAVTLCDGVSEIASFAFQSCKALSGIVLPESIAEIGSYAFDGCSNLHQIVFLGDAPAISAYAFYNRTATAYYPAGNATWTADTLKSYGGSITWVPMETEEIKLNVWAPSADQDWLAERLSAFENANPQWNIEWTTGSCEAGDAGAMLQADPAGGADVYFFAHDQRYLLAEAGALTPLTDSDAAWAQAQTGEAMMNTVVDADGNYYGIPVSGNTWFMYYNKAQLTQEDVKSLEAMLEKGIVAFEFENGWNFAAFYFANGGTMFGETGADADAGIRFGGENGAAVTARLAELMQHPNFRNNADGYGNVGMKDGTVAAYFSGAWDYAGLYEVLGEDLGAVQLPTITIGGARKQMKSFLGSTAIGVNPNCGNEEAARALAVFLASEDSQLARWEMSGAIPAAATLAEEPTIAAHPAARAQMDTQNNTAVPQPAVSEMSDYWINAAVMSSWLLNGEITRDNAAERTEEWNAMLNGTAAEKTVIATGYSGALTWELTDDGVLTFSGDGKMKNYTYKSEMPWYPYFGQITQIVLEEGVTSIGDYAFYGMPNLLTISIPESVTTIGNYAFKNCPVLDGVMLPGQLNKLGESAFYACTSLRLIEIPASLWTIQPYTFKNCTALETILFNEGNLMKISDGAFYNTAVTELVLPDCLTILDVYSFKNCAKLESITLSGSLTQIREAVFYGTAIPTIEIPEGVTSIGPYAFKNCVSLETIELPETLTSVGEASFYACTALQSLELPDAVTKIGNYAFRKCAELRRVTFSDSLVNIGESSFYGCESLFYLAIPGNVTTIQGYAFKGCLNLGIVELPDSLKTLGDSAFHTCTGLDEIIIPAGVTKVGEYCFSGSTGIDDIYFLGDAPAIGTGAFNKLSATAYYPSGNASWTAAVRQNYGGSITWMAN